MHRLQLQRYMFKVNKCHYNGSGVHVLTRVVSLFKYLLDRRLMRAASHRSGHNMYGRYTSPVKGSRAHTRNVIMLYTLKKFKYFLYLGWYYKKALTPKIYTCCINTAGQRFYLPLTTQGSVLTLLPIENFSWIYFFLPRQATVRVRLFDMVCKIRNFTRVCYVAPNRGSICSIARACGSSARLLSYRRVLSENLTTARLPSGKLKYLYIYNTAMLGSILPRRHNTYQNTKAGYWRNLGIRPRVRGTAMNPVDHPHGGRCKAVRWPRTPWGLSTK